MIDKSHVVQNLFECTFLRRIDRGLSSSNKYQRITGTDDFIVELSSFFRIGINTTESLHNCFEIFISNKLINVDSFYGEDNIFPIGISKEKTLNRFRSKTSNE